MADHPDRWYMSAATDRGTYQGTVMAAPHGVVSGTEKRDVSDMLDLLALADTPFVNKIGWGPESGGLCIEWISEDLGPGVIINASLIASDNTSIVISSIDGMTPTNASYQVPPGSVVYAYSSFHSQHTMFVIASIEASLTCIISDIVATSMTITTSIPAGNKFYVMGHLANEGSMPGEHRPRQRAVTTNNFTILRQDVAITGSMKSTDMYAIGREDRHQMLMRMKELQRQREMVSLFSDYVARTTTNPSMMFGVLGFLLTQSGTHIDSTTRVLTETAFNDVVGTLWDYGSENLSVFGSRPQLAKFTQWDKNRIRQSVNEGKGGGYIKSYLTEAGVEVDLYPGRVNWPRNLLFVLDTSQIKLRAKKGRKGIMQKLGLMGDSEDWQIISEFSLEMKGYNLKRHGMFDTLLQS